MRRRSTTSRPGGGGRPGRPPPPSASALGRLVGRMKPQATKLKYTFSESEGIAAEINQFFSHEDCDAILSRIVRDSKGIPEDRYAGMSEVPFREYPREYASLWLVHCLGLFGDHRLLFEELVVQRCVTAFRQGAVHQMLPFIMYEDITPDNVTTFVIALAVFYICLEAFRILHAKRGHDAYKHYSQDAAAFREVIATEETLLPAMVAHFTASQSSSFLPTCKLCLVLWKLLQTRLGDLAQADDFRQERRAACGLKEAPSRHEGCMQAPAKSTLADVEEYVRRVSGQFSFVRDPETGRFDYPPDVKEGYNVLLKHLYVPLSAVHAREEEEHRFSRDVSAMHAAYVGQRHPDIEAFYTSFRPVLKATIKALLVVLLHCRPAKEDLKGDQAFWGADTLQDAMASGKAGPTKVQVHSVRRTQEIALKAVSATLLLLMKYLKSNHYLQFEEVCMYVVDCKGIPVMLRLLNQSIERHATAFHDGATHQALAYLWPLHQEGDNPFLPMPAQPGKSASEKKDAEKKDSEKPRDASAETGDGESAGDEEQEKKEATAEEEAESGRVVEEDMVCKRNMFSLICLTRIIQKLVKHKPARRFVLGTEKGAMILKRCLKVEHPMLNLYTLKVLKNIVRFLPRGWRKSNMHLISRVDQTVRQKMMDDWHFMPSPMEGGPLPDQEAEEEKLTEDVRQFVERHYEGRRRPRPPLSQDPDHEGEQQPSTNWFSASIPEDLKDVTVDSLLQEAEDDGVDMVIRETDFLALTLPPSQAPST